MFYGTYGVKMAARPGMRALPRLSTQPGGQLIPLERTPDGKPCRYPGVTYWPDLNPCARPTGALFQDDATWKKYQQTGYWKMKGGDGFYHPEDAAKAAASQEIETAEVDWKTYALYAGVAISGAAALYFGYKFFTKKKG